MHFHDFPKEETIGIEREIKPKCVHGLAYIWKAPW